MSITREVKNLILQFPKNQLFSSSDVYMKYFTEFCSESSFFKIINRMQKEGSIIIIQKGIFYLPKYKEGKRISIRQHNIKSFIFSNNNDGVLTGEGLYFKLKLSNITPKEYHYYTNQIVEQSKRIRNTRFTYLPIDFDPSSSTIIQLLDILSSFNKIEEIDISMFNKYLNESIMYFDIATFEIINKSLQYAKYVIAFLKEILDNFGIENNLDRYLSTRSAYKIPAWK